MCRVFPGLVLVVNAVTVSKQFFAGVVFFPTTFAGVDRNVADNFQCCVAMNEKVQRDDNFFPSGSSSR